MSQISNSLLDNIEICQKEICLSFSKQTIREHNGGHSIILNLRQGLSNVSVQTLLENFFIEEEIQRTCSQCKIVTTHKLSKTVTPSPKTIVIMLGWYHVYNSEIKKNT